MYAPRLPVSSTCASVLVFVVIRLAHSEDELCSYGRAPGILQNPLP